MGNTGKRHYSYMHTVNNKSERVTIAITISMHIYPTEAILPRHL